LHQTAATVVIVGISGQPGNHSHQRQNGGEKQEIGQGADAIA
jgi:hypothetical protein